MTKLILLIIVLRKFQNPCIMSSIQHFSTLSHPHFFISVNYLQIHFKLY
jgi:hypothetical protein